MIAAVLMALQFAAGEGSYKTLFPIPTGRNGLEDYVLAKDLLDQGYWEAYLKWSPPEGRAEVIRQKQLYERNMGIQKEDPKLAAIEVRLADLPLLQVREEEVASFAKSHALVSEGNSKACDVPVVLNGIRIPTATIFADLGTLERDTAYVEASRSHTDLMVEDMENILQMVDHGCRTTLIAGMIATLTQLKVCSMCAENLDRFSLQDATEIETMVNRFFQSPPIIVDAFRAAFLSSEKDVSESIHALKQTGSKATTDRQLSAFNSVVNPMSDLDVDQMVQRIQQSIEANARTFLARFAGPEQNWLGPDTPDDSQNPDPIVRTPDDVESYFTLHWSLPGVTGPRRVAETLRARAMMRLLRLHARIIAFRWQNDRLPKTLAEMNLPLEYEFDPLSKGAFVYQLSADGFRLFSPGSKQTGRVELGAAGAGSQRTQVVDP